MMAIWRVDSAASIQWTTNTPKILGDRVVCRFGYATEAARGYVYECTTAGTTHATTEPTWPTTPGNTVVDNDITWTCRSPSDGTWANASAYLFYILNHTTIAAGDFVYLDDGHYEDITTAISLYWVKGSAVNNNPIYILSVDKATDQLSAGATIYLHYLSIGIIYFRGSIYSYGVYYRNYGNINIYNTTDYPFVILESDGSDVLGLNYTGKLISINYITSINPATVIIRNAGINFQNANNKISLYSSAKFIWEGGSLTAPNGSTSLIYPYGLAQVKLRDVDLSAIGAGATATSIVDVSQQYLSDLTVSRCLLPTDAGFSFVTGAWGYHKGIIKSHHCGAANNTYQFLESSYEGTCEDEDSIVRDGGFEHNETPVSYKMSSSANVVDRFSGLESRPIEGWTDSTSETTFKIEGIIDSATNLQDDEIWMTLEYPANNTDSLGSLESSRCAFLATPSDCEASSVTWNNTGGMSNPNKFKLSVTVTPGKAGPITAKVFLAKASTIVYIDPIVTES